MEPNQINSQKSKTGAKDFFLNLGAIVALYTAVVNLINLLFTIINTAYPQVTSGYNYFGSQSISWPVAILIIFFPVYVLLMWILERGYIGEPEKKQLGIRRWLTYITLFIAGLALAIDLVTVIYYFIDGQELTTGFLLKILAVLIVTLAIFMYYISDIREKLNSKSRKIWLLISILLTLASIIWGFSVLGSPRTQRLYKYDEQKVNDLRDIDQRIYSYWNAKKTLPDDLNNLSEVIYNNGMPVDPQTNKSYEYKKMNSDSYELCADFNKLSDETKKAYYATPYPNPVADSSWSHPAGKFCFPHTIDSSWFKNSKIPM